MKDALTKKKSSTLNVCPSCGTYVESPIKTWHIVSPLPDARGRITLTIMASYLCPKCGTKWKGVQSKVKVGEEDVEVEGTKGTRRLESETKSSRPGETIELDLEDIMRER